MRTVDLIGWTLVQYYKERFGRRRPSEVDPTIRPMIRVPTFSSYPSGHSTQIHLINLALQAVLADRIKPDHDWLTETSLVDEMNDIAERIAVNREVAGVHYKSDTEAGVTLAAGIWRLIGSNDNFAQMIEAARAEWRPDRAIQSGYSFLRRSLERTA